MIIDQPGQSVRTAYAFALFKTARSDGDSEPRYSIDLLPSFVHVLTTLCARLPSGDSLKCFCKFTATSRIMHTPYRTILAYLIIAVMMQVETVSVSVRLKTQNKICKEINHIIVLMN